jgi:Domain of unknown function (DUF4286)
MIIYNVTIKVDHSIAENWINWLREEHIPEMINTGCFTKATILQMLDNEEEDGKTFAIQYHAPGISFYNRYIENHADKMRQKSIDKWGQRFIAFRTVMEVVN